MYLLELMTVEGDGGVVCQGLWSCRLRQRRRGKQRRQVIAGPIAADGVFDDIVAAQEEIGDRHATVDDAVRDVGRVG